MRSLLVSFAHVVCVALCVCGVGARAGSEAAVRAALVDFYESTNGASWKDQSNWLTGDPCTVSAHWFGVKCNATAVVSLRLHDNNLTGSISTLTALEDLEMIDLSHNFIRGELPALPLALEELEFGYNRIVGTIPHSYSKMQSLHVLHLNNNALTGLIPEWVCDIPYWSLEYNKFACDSRPVCCTEKPYCGTCIESDSGNTMIIIIVFSAMAVTTIAIILTLLYRRVCTGRKYEAEEQKWGEGKGFLQKDGLDEVFDSDDDDVFAKDAAKEEVNAFVY